MSSKVIAEVISGSHGIFGNRLLTKNASLSVSGSIGALDDPSERGISVFGGDTFISGALHVSRSIILGHTSQPALLQTFDGLNALLLDGDNFLDLKSDVATRMYINGGAGSNREALTLFQLAGVIINDDAESDMNFRAETGGPNPKTHALYVSAGTDQVLVLSGGSPTSYNEAAATDVNFYVSGSVGSRGTAVQGTSVFGGDAVVSGALYVSTPGTGQDVTFYGKDSDAVGLQWDHDSDEHGRLSLGANNHGVDFKVFGETASRHIHWDQSHDTLYVWGSISSRYDQVFDASSQGWDFTVNSNSRVGLFVDGSENQVYILSGGDGSGPASPNPANATDLAFFVSGTIGSKGTAVPGTSVFGGDVVISGSLFGGSPLSVGTDMVVSGDIDVTGDAKGAGLVFITQHLSGSSDPTPFPDNQASTPINMTDNEGLWHFEGNANDSSGNGNNGTLANAPTQTLGKVGEFAYTFVNASSQKITIPGNVGNMIPDYPFSVAFWAKCSDTPAGDFHDAMVGNASNNSWADGWGTFWTNSTTVRFWINQYDGNTSASDFAEVGSLNPLVWNHFVGTYDGTTISLYVNGVLGDTTALSNQSLTGLTNNLLFGHMPTSFYFNGALDEIAIWSRSISASEAENIYTLQTEQATTLTVAGPSVFNGSLVVSGAAHLPTGLSGSLTRLTDGSSYLIAGSNVTITSASNGAVTIASSGGGGGVDGAGAATRIPIWADSNTIMSNPGLHFNSFTLGLTGSASGPTSALDTKRIYSNVSSNTTLSSHAGASGILVDYDVTSAVAGSQFQKHKGLWIKYNQAGPNHVGTIQGEGLKVEVTGSDAGFSQTIDGINVVVNHPGTFDNSSGARGISVTAPPGRVNGEVNASHIRCLNTATTDYFDISVGVDGRSQIATHDGNDNTALAHLNLKPDGILMIHSGSEHDDAGGNAQNYTDINLFVSGSRGSRGTSVAGTSVFGGDMVVSGTLTAIRSDDGVNSAIRIDKHYAGTTSVGSVLSTGDDPAGLKINYDVVGAVGGASIAAHDALSINYSQDVPTMAGVIQATGADIRMVGGTSGTQTMKGIAITLAGATTCTGIDLTLPNDSAAFVARSSDHILDQFKLTVGADGATILSTNDFHAAAADLTLDADGKIIIEAAAGDEVVFNEAGVNADFRVESSAEDEAIFLNASGNKLHFNKGKSAFSTTIWSNHNNALEVNSQGVTLNDLGDANNNFRVETVAKTHALFIDAATDQILIHSGGAATSPIGYGHDTMFFVSGTMGEPEAGQNARSGRPNEGLSVFGGDLLSSGTVFTSTVRSTTEHLRLRGTDTGKEVSIGSSGIFLTGGNFVQASATSGDIHLSARDLIRLHTHGAGGTIQIGPKVVPSPTEMVLILSGGGPTSENPVDYPDVSFFVSGSSGFKGQRGTSLFGGDVVVSGSTQLPNARFNVKGTTVFDSHMGGASVTFKNPVDFDHTTTFNGVATFESDVVMNDGVVTNDTFSRGTWSTSAQTVTSIDARGKNLIQLRESPSASPWTVTNLHHATVGQVVTFTKHPGDTVTTTIQDNAVFLLNGSTDFVMNAEDTLTLVAYSQSAWLEIGRSVR